MDSDPTNQMDMFWSTHAFGQPCRKMNWSWKTTLTSQMLDPVTWTTTFGYILNTALTRMGGGDPAAGDHMEVHLQMLELLSKVRGGPDPTAYTEILKGSSVGRSWTENGGLAASFLLRLPTSTGEVETLETISHQRAGTDQPEGPGGPLEEEMGGTPIGTFNPPCWGYRTPCPLSGETMRNRSSMISLEIPASGHFVRDALFWNRCSNGTCRSPGKRAAMLGSFSTASGPRRSPPTSFSSVGTHYVGSPRNSDFWLCRKNTAFFRRSRPWRQDSLLQ